MTPIMWPRMRDDYEPGSADPGQSLVKSASQDAWEPGAEPGGPGPKGDKGDKGDPGPKGDKGDKGDPGGWVPITQLPIGTDLNTVVTPGLYRSDGIWLEPNAPPASGGQGFWLEVSAVSTGETYVQQRMTSLSMTNGLPQMWIRNKYGVWRAWRRVVVEGDVGGGDIVGTGMPNGVVAAAPGTYYTDTAGTNGAWRWLKKAGTGNTGWEVVVGDTGWRDVSANLSSGFKTAFPGAKAFLRRQGDTIYLVLENGANAVGPATLYPALYDLPGGFRGSDSRRMASSSAIIASSGAAATDGTSLYTSDGASLNGRWTTTRTFVSFSHPFDLSRYGNTPWPTVLPGVPA